jgi:hypothetical protein
MSPFTNRWERVKGWWKERVWWPVKDWFVGDDPENLPPKAEHPPLGPTLVYAENCPCNNCRRIRAERDAAGKADSAGKADPENDKFPSEERE